MPVGRQRSSSFCPNCGAHSTAQARYCASCGLSLSATVPQTDQSMPVDPAGLVLNPNPLPPWGAALCSLLVAGLGQMLLGQVAKGAVILLVSVVVGVLTAGFGAIIIWLIAAVDAYQIAKKLNSGAQVRKWEWF